MPENNIIGFAQEPTRNEKLSVGTTSIVVSEARNLQNKRKNIVIRNTSSGSQVITINLGYGVAENEAGIVLKVNESFSDSSETGYEAYQGVITSISSGAGAQLSIYER